MLCLIWVPLFSIFYTILKRHSVINFTGNLGTFIISQPSLTHRFLVFRKWNYEEASKLYIPHSANLVPERVKVTCLHPPNVIMWYLNLEALTKWCSFIYISIIPGMGDLEPSRCFWGRIFIVLHQWLCWVRPDEICSPARSWGRKAGYF